jgi:hypothetical protein
MKRLVIAAVLAAASLLTVAPTPVHAQPPADGLTIPITGTGTGGTFDGTFTLTRFVVSGDGIAAVGRLVGTARDTAGNVVGSIVRTVTLPVGPISATQATCDILHLELGPLELDLLGLVVNLNRIVLDIDAQSGPGNLLGNLLCSVAGLLDNPGGLARLLNQILGILG